MRAPRGLVEEACLQLLRQFVRSVCCDDALSQRPSHPMGTCAPCPTSMPTLEALKAAAAGWSTTLLAVLLPAQLEATDSDPSMLYV